MSNQQQPAVAIPLPKGKKNAVQWGCVFMMLSVALYGAVFQILTAPLLAEFDAMEYVSLFSIFAGLGVSIMTPIGGKLGDIIGRRNIVVIPGIICAVAGISMAFIRSLWPLMFLRLAVSFAQGAFTAAPYIIASLINERKDVPKAMGMMATAIAIGGFGGAMIAGALADIGLMSVGIIMPAVPLLIGVLLIGLNLPNIKKEGKVTLDVAGIIALVVTLCGLLLAINFGASMGWTNPAILAGFAIGIIGLVVLIVVEGKVADPLIPLKLFKNKRYVFILLVGFIGYFYLNAIQVYGPIGAMQVMGTSTTAAGSLQLPRTLVTMILPTIAGAWVAKKLSRRWQAMAVSVLLPAIATAIMGFTSPSMSVIVYFVTIAITGIAESCRSVVMMPAAQGSLEPQDIGIGTSLINFANSLSTTISAAVFGVAYNVFTVADPTNTANIQSGVNAVYWTSTVVSVIGILLVVFIVRPLLAKDEVQAQ